MGMQVACSNCQLSFEAPDGATGLVCPICRSPLRAPDAAAEPDGVSARQIVDWSGGTLDDLVAILSLPAWSARVEVIPAGGGNPVGEVHVIAGGVSDAIHDGKSTHDALDNLRAVKGARFRIEPRLPGPSNGDLSVTGPDQGKLEERPLATLMRYCEDYVLTCGIEVWRGNENAKVDYRRGEIVGVTVGGIDAPERLAEVMKWSSGRYKLIVPKLTLPETAPKAATPATVVAPRAANVASRTIFGMPALDPAAIALAAEKAKAVQAQQAQSAPAAVAPAQVRPSAPALVAPTARAAAAAAAATAAAATTATTVPSAAPAPAATGTTIPPAPAAVAATGSQAATLASGVVPVPATPRQSVAKTIFGVPAPVVPAPAAAPIPAPAPVAPLASARQSAPTGSGIASETTRPPRTGSAPQSQTTPGLGKRQAPGSTTATMEVDRAERADRTFPTKTPKPRPNETPVWTYIGVGFVFGLALLGVYRLVMVLAH